MNDFQSSFNNLTTHTGDDHEKKIVPKSRSYIPLYIVGALLIVVAAALFAAFVKPGYLRGMTFYSFFTRPASQPSATTPLVYISYYDKIATDLSLAYGAITTDQGFNTRTISQPEHDVGEYSALALDPTGALHVVAYDRTHASLLHFVSTGAGTTGNPADGNWKIETIDTNLSGGSVSFTSDLNGKMHVSYVDEAKHELKYASNVSGAWSTEVVGEASEVKPSVAVDSTGAASIVYGSFSAGVGDVNLATRTTSPSGVQWSTTKITSVGRSQPIAVVKIDGQNKLHVVYSDPSTQSLTYIHNLSGTWKPESIETNNAERFFSLALDKDNHPHVAYYAPKDDSVKYANTISNGHWFSQRVDSAKGVGQYPSIAVDSQGRAYISYYDQTNQSLKYATNNTSGGAFVARTVIQAPGDRGLYSSIALWPPLVASTPTTSSIPTASPTPSVSPSSSPAIPAARATLISFSAPSPVTAGEPMSVVLTIKNSGTVPWTTTSGYKLGSAKPDDNTACGAQRVSLPKDVAPGEIVPVGFTATAPAASGPCSWQLLQEGVARFPDIFTKTITVTAPLPRNALFIEAQVPNPVKAGKAFTATIKVKNTGTETWVATGKNPYRLGSQVPQDNIIWGIGRVALTKDVAPNETTIFTINATAPSKKRDYVFAWKMVQDGITWFGPILLQQTITVTP